MERPLPAPSIDGVAARWKLARPVSSVHWASVPHCATDDGGLYVILVSVVRPVRVERPGSALIPSGTCAYVGSARRNLRARVRRHFRREKPKKWHIDQLTTNRCATVAAAVLLPNATMTECELNMTVGGLLRGSVPAPRFGASDCRAGCPAHLWKCGTTLRSSEVAEMLLASPAFVGGVLVCGAAHASGRARRVDGGRVQSGGCRGP